MAAPITHIVLTDKVFNKHFSDKEKEEFYVGTSLADIRYLGVVERDKTHFKNLSLQDVINDNSFDAGLKFHSLVDEVREQFMRKHDYYSLFPKSELLSQASKVLEDIIPCALAKTFKYIQTLFGLLAFPYSNLKSR